MSLNWFISNIHSVQWNPTQQLKMHYAKLKKKNRFKGLMLYDSIFSTLKRQKYRDRKQNQWLPSTGSRGRS